MNVTTNVACFFPEHFAYHHIEELDDLPTENIRQYFYDALNFMRNSVETGGKVRGIHFIKIKVVNTIIILNFIDALYYYYII